MKTYKSEDNINTKNLKSTVKAFLKALDTKAFKHDGHTLELDELEFESRDGFIAYDHNRGGMDLINLVTYSEIENNSCGSTKAISDFVQRQYENMLKDHPNYNKMTEDEQFETYDAYMGHENDNYIGRRIRVMYEGNNVLCVHYGFDMDAPYFRWTEANGDETNMIEIKFKNKVDLKKQLVKAGKKIIKFF